MNEINLPPTRKKQIARLMLPCLGVLIISLLLSGCLVRSEPLPNATFPGGDRVRGQQKLQDYGCGACHTIPGVTGAHTTVGPSLENWARRHNIAGNMPNTPDNMLVWLQAPQQLEPGTLMPNLNVTEQDARDMGAYLYSLE